MALKINFLPFGFMLAVLIATYAEAERSPEPSPTRRPGSRAPGQVETIPMPGIDLSQPPREIERIPPPPIPQAPATQRYMPIPPSKIPAVKDHGTATAPTVSAPRGTCWVMGPRQSEVDRKRELCFSFGRARS
ncbi:MAG: hypothetical protein R3A80_08335 [Bdellovibrionota bacterium]